MQRPRPIWATCSRLLSSDLRRLLYRTGAQLEALGAKIGRPFRDQDEIGRRIEEDLLDMPRLKNTPDPIRGKKRVREALSVLKQQEREMQRIPLALPTGKAITLTSGGQNVLVKKIIEDFCPIFTPGAKPLYVGDTGDKVAYFDSEALKALGVSIETHGKMPDVVIHHETKGRLVLIQAVTTHGPIDPKRRLELQRRFKGGTGGCVYVTASLTRNDLLGYLNDIAWETEVWVAESPTHLIHFNGERLLGPA